MEAGQNNNFVLGSYFEVIGIPDHPNHYLLDCSIVFDPAVVFDSNSVHISDLTQKIVDHPSNYQQTDFSCDYFCFGCCFVNFPIADHNLDFDKSYFHLDSIGRHRVTNYPHFADNCLAEVVG